MKTLLALLLTAAALTSARAQLVTNTGVDFVWSQATEDTLRLAFKIDENLRTNGIAPYTNAVASVNYKTFLSELMTARITADATMIAAQNEARFLAAFRGLQVTNNATYNKLYRIAFNKGSQ